MKGRAASPHAKIYQVPPPPGGAVAVTYNTDAYTTYIAYNAVHAVLTIQYDHLRY